MYNWFNFNHSITYLSILYKFRHNLELKCIVNSFFIFEINVRKH